MKKKNDIELVPPILFREDQIALWNKEHGLDKGWIYTKKLTLEEALEDYGYLMSDKEREELIKKCNEANE